MDTSLLDRITSQPVSLKLESASAKSQPASPGSQTPHVAARPATVADHGTARSLADVPAPVPRFDFYSSIHKGIRAFINSTLEMKWMVPALAHVERVGMLEGMRNSAPAPVFDHMVLSIRSMLSERNWDKLARALPP